MALNPTFHSELLHARNWHFGTSATQRVTIKHSRHPAMASTPVAGKYAGIAASADRFFVGATLFGGGRSC